MIRSMVVMLISIVMSVVSARGVVSVVLVLWGVGPIVRNAFGN